MLGECCVFIFYFLYFFSLLVNYCRLVEFASLLGIFELLSLTPLYLLVLVSHCRASCSKQIYVPIATSFQASSLPACQYVVKCASCACFKPLRAHHCRVCKRCVYKMDHHCPWIDNCLGFHNHKHYFLFIAYLFVLSWCTEMLILYKFVYLLYRQEVMILAPLIKDHILVFLLFLIGIASCVFSTVMLARQVYGIHHNVTTIELKKGYSENEKKAGCLGNYREVFGMGDVSVWLSPFHPPLLDMSASSFQLQRSRKQLLN